MFLFYWNWKSLNYRVALSILKMRMFDRLGEMINSFFGVSDFNSVINSLEQEVIALIDQLEIYNTELSKLINVKKNFTELKEEQICVELKKNINTNLGFILRFLKKISTARNSDLKNIEQQYNLARNVVNSNEKFNILRLKIELLINQLNQKLKFLTNVSRLLNDYITLIGNDKQIAVTIRLLQLKLKQINDFSVILYGLDEKLKILLNFVKREIRVENHEAQGLTYIKSNKPAGDTQTLDRNKFGQLR